MINTPITKYAYNAILSRGHHYRDKKILTDEAIERACHDLGCDRNQLPFEAYRYLQKRYGCVMVSKSLQPPWSLAGSTSLPLQFVQPRGGVITYALLSSSAMIANYVMASGTDENLGDIETEPFPCWTDDCIYITDWSEMIHHAERSYECEVIAMHDCVYVRFRYRERYGRGKTVFAQVRGRLSIKDHNGDEFHRDQLYVTADTLTEWIGRSPLEKGSFSFNVEAIFVAADHSSVGEDLLIPKGIFAELTEDNKDHIRSTGSNYLRLRHIFGMMRESKEATAKFDTNVFANPGRAFFPYLFDERVHRTETERLKKGAHIMIDSIAQQGEAILLPSY